MTPQEDSPTSSLESRVRIALQSSRVRPLLLALGMLPIGWLLFDVLGSRSSQEYYRSDEDLYTLLSLVGMLILAVGLVCVLVSIYKWMLELVSR